MLDKFKLIWFTQVFFIGNMHSRHKKSFYQLMLT